MPLQICSFDGKLGSSLASAALPVPLGAPVATSVADFTGSFTVAAGVTLIKIVGTGSIAWPGVTEPEKFDGIEFRGVRPAQQFTVA